MSRLKMLRGVLSKDGFLLTLLVALAAYSSVSDLFILRDPSLLPARGQYSPNLVTPVMIALGRGFVEPSQGDSFLALYPSAPDLTRFLHHEIDYLSPAQVPCDLPAGPPLGNWQYRHRYLCYAIGLLWRVFGISWDVVTALCIVMFCVMIGAIYGLMRLGMGRFWSVIATLLTMMSAQMVFCISNVRDYGKGPFILLIILILGFLIKRPVKRSVYLGLALLLGLLIGIGGGFRADVLACLPPALFVLACCRRARPGIVIGERLAAIGLLCLCFFILGAPLKGVYSGGNLFAHDILMGQATKCGDLLGTTRASYEKVYVNHDTFIGTMACRYYERSQNPLAFPREDIDERPFLIALVRTFPADILTRAYSSVLWVANAGSKSFVAIIVVTLCAVFALLMIAYHNHHIAWMTLVVFLYFGGYVALQPETRHMYHLVFIPYWIVAFVLDKAIPAIRHRRSRRVIANGNKLPGNDTDLSREPITPTLKRLALFALPAALLLVIPLQAARAYQRATLGSVLDAYERADLVPVQTQIRSMKNWVMFERSVYGPPRAEALKRTDKCNYNVQYWVAEFSPSTSWRRIWLQYATGKAFTGDNWYTHGLWIAPSAKNDTGPLRYFFPVIENTDVSQPDWAVFSGVAVPQEEATGFRGLFRVRNGKDFPFFMNLSLPADRSALVRCETLVGMDSWTKEADVAREWLMPMPAYKIPAQGDHYEGNELKESLKAYQDGLSSGADSALFRLGLAVCREPELDSGAALKAYRESLAANPTFFVTYYYVDAFFKRTGDLNGRVALWKDACNAYPDNYLPFYHLAMALQASGDTDGAIASYRRAVELDASDPRTRIELGRLLEAQKEFPNAIEMYRQAVNIDPLDEQTVGALNALTDMQSKAQERSTANSG